MSKEWETNKFESIGLMFFPLGITIGIVVTWWREGLGGVITVASFLAFYVIHLASDNTFPKGWGRFLFSIPGFLFLLCWYRSQKAKTATG